ncbi:MAG: polysaccharide deacetylase family protein [Bacteroidota bacterium]
MRASLLLLATLASLTAGCIPSRGTVEYMERRSPSALFSVPSVTDSLLALTFDDGPEPGHTDRVLDVLASHDVRATFFLVGERVKRNSQLAQRIAAEGHEVANHGWTRDPAFFMSGAKVQADIERTDRLLRAFGDPVWYRPSVGFYHDGVIRAVDSTGYRIALGSVTTNDPQNPFIGMQARHILREARPGDILVLHDGIGDRTKAPAILERVLPELKRRGYRFVSLSELVAAGEASPSASVPRREDLTRRE